MTTAILKLERNEFDNRASTTVGVHLKAYLDQASIPLEDINVFVYEVIPFGAGVISMFIGIVSPSDMGTLLIGEPVTPVVGTRFRLGVADLVFRSDIHLEKVITALTEDIKEYFRLKTSIATVPGSPFVVVIS